jgi:hypothetical protein
MRLETKIRISNEKDFFEAISVLGTGKKKYFFVGNTSEIFPTHAS